MAELNAEEGASITVQLDDVILSRFLAFNIAPQARLCCQSWDKVVVDALQLEPRIAFHKQVRTRGSVTLFHSAVRSMGGDFHECCSYQFEFFASGKFDMS